MRLIKRFKTLTAVAMAAFYFFSLAPSLLAAPATPTVRPGVNVAPPPPPAPPACPLVTGINPSSLRQGQSATLILSGRDLNQIVSITLGTGITVKTLNNSNPNSAQVSVEVAVNAPLGVHALLMTTPAVAGAVGCGTVEARPKLQILARSSEQTPDVVAPPTQPAKPPTVSIQPGRIPGITTSQPSQTDKKLWATEIYPNQWSRGKNYTANLVGLGFTADMLVQLGDGVQVKGKVKLLNPNLAQIQVEVSGSAGIGERKVQLRLNSQDSWTLTPATAYVKAPAGQGLTQIKLSEMDFKNFLKGKIRLQQPYEEGTNATKFINDMTQFWWEEENPGTADWYELRFLGSQGQILLKRRIDPSAPGQKPPQFYKPDQVFFDEMCNHKPDGLCGYYLNQTSGTAAMLLNFNWEVAGFKTYTYTKITKIPGTTPGNEKVVKTTETKEIEVEISERWKISGPIQPSGLACTNNEMKKGLDADSQLQIVNLDIAKGRPAGTANTVNFVNDQFKLFGQFRFWNPPYNYQAGSFAGPQYTQFDSIFVDWGDGTTTPLRGVPYTDSWGDQRLQIPEGMYQHRYTKTGLMVFRIFMLPFKDIQNTDPAQVTANYDSQHSNNGNDPYFAVLKAGSGGVWPYGSSGGQSGPSLDDLAKRAHMLYCKEIVIDPRQDPIMNGPLHLVSLEITGINGRGFNEPVANNGPPATITAQINPAAQKTFSKAGAGPNVPKVQANVKIKTGPAASAINKTMAGVQVNPSALYEASDISLSACDMLQFNASLAYYGKGEAWVTWRINTNLSQGGLNDLGGLLIASQYPVLIGPSRSRDMSQIQPEQADQATTASYDTYPLDSPIQKMEAYPVGQAYSLKPEVTVGPETVKTLTAQIIVNACKASAGSQAQSGTDTDLAMSRSGQEPEVIVSDMIRPQYWEAGQAYAANLAEPMLLAKAAAKTTAPKSTASPTGAMAMVQAIKKSGAKLGVLSPFSEGSRMPVVASINGALKQPGTDAPPEYDTTFPKKPPFYASAHALSYKAVPNSPDKPCKFLFTTKSGDVFEIFNLQDVKADSLGRYWGHGTMQIQLFTGSFFQRYKRLLPVKISGWKLAGDQSNVAAGTLLKENLSDQVPPASGMKITMEKLEAKAYQTDLNLTLSIAPQDQRLRVPGSSEPVAWKNRSARLTAMGDWFYQDQNEKKISIGWSGFRLEKVKAALDLSSQENHPQGGPIQADGISASSGNEWTGIHLGQALLIPNTASLSGSNPYNKTVNNWGIMDGGLCGNADLGPFNTTRKGGTIGWDSLHANAEQGNFNATYNNMKVRLPWPFVELKGNAVLADGAPGQDSFIDFRNVKADKVTRNYGTIIMESSDFVFGMYSNDFSAVDWAVKGNTRFSFKQEGQIYSTDTVVQDVVFGMDAIAYHKGNVQIPLNGKATFGAVPLDLISMDVSGFNTKALKFDLKTKFSVSEVLEAVDVQLTYGLAKPGNAFIDDYQVVNPVLQPFNIQVAYPAFQPKVNSQMTLKFKKGAQSFAGLRPEHPQYASLDRKLIRPTVTDAGAPLDEELLLADNGSGTEDTFNAENINMQMLGESMPNVEFRLGYKEGHDYWLMRVMVNVVNMPLAPPFLYAYQIRGGLGHNFPIETFSAPGSIYAVEPVINGSYLFNAGLLAGSADKVLYAFDGDFTISTEEGALFKFKAWIMKYDHSGQGDFGGYLAYAGGSFDGSLSGEFGYIGDQVKIVVPEGAATLHFGDDGWYIYLGKDVGPRLEGHTFFIDANAYLMLDSTPRLRVGAGALKHFAVGNCDKVCAYIDVHFDAGFDMSLNPMYIAGEMDFGASAGLCVWKFGCLDIGITLHAWASVPPPYLYIEFSTSATPCPVDSIGIGLKILPSPGIGWSIDWCDCLIFDC